MNESNSLSARPTPPNLNTPATICHQLAGYDFTWELNRSLELAILRTFCVPRISRLLRQTGEFEYHPQKRYDDTSLILGNILKWGYDSHQGKAAIARMNRIHQRFNIANEDYLYVLSTSIYEPIYWNRRFGWRPFTDKEKQALYLFWKEVGHRMGLVDIPETYDAFEQFKQAYEETYFQYNSDNQIVGNAVINLMRSWFPPFVAPFIPTVVNSVIDAPMRKALGWPDPSPVATQTVTQLLKWSRKVAKHLPRRRRPGFIVDLPNATYPRGYDIERLGPGTRPAPSSESRCPFLRMRSFLKADT